MFGSSNPFGQSSNSPFGLQSAFGQTSNANTNPFSPKPFGSTTPFGSQTGASIFGSTSTGVFGATQSSSPLSSTSVFGASSSSPFGSTTPAFGASSSPAFGSSSSSFGSSGASIFGQKPAFGGFGSTTAQSSPFGSSFQQSQPAFGSNLFGSSTPFGTSNQPAFGTPSTPTFGSSSTPAFGATSTPAFGATTAPAFGSAASPAFGSTASPFGVSSSPGFGSSTPAFGASSSPVFGATSTPAFGASSTPAFGATSTPAASVFGASSTPSFSFASSSAFGQSSPAFGSSQFGNAASPFGSQSSPFGAQASTATFGSPGFGQSAHGGQRGGSRVQPYTPTPEADSGTQPAGKLESISAMPVYKEKSHEELRWEDYQVGDKGGPTPAGQPAPAISFGGSAFGSSATPTFGQSSANAFAPSAASNLFASKTPTFTSPGFGSSSSPSFGSAPFGNTTTSNLFGSTSLATPSVFGSSTLAFGANTSPSPFASSTLPAFGSTTSIFGSSSGQATTPSFGSGASFGNTQSSPLFQSSAHSFGITSSPFGSSTSAFGQSSPILSQSSFMSSPSLGLGLNVFSSTPSVPTSVPGGFGQTASSIPSLFQPSQPAQSTGAFGFSNFGQTQGGTTGFGSTHSMFGQSTMAQPGTQSAVVSQPAPITNPFGTLPAMPQMSIGRTGTSPSVQYGISSLPVADKPAPVRISSLLTSRHLSQRRIRLPVRKYNPKSDGPKVPFFSDDEETTSTPKADALFVPRENPRALVIRPIEQLPLRASIDEVNPVKNVTISHQNGKHPEAASIPANGSHIEDEDKDLVEEAAAKEQNHSLKLGPKSNGLNNGNSVQKSGASITLSGHRAGEAAIVYEHGADIEALMPKLRHSDYYTEPRIQELAAKERAEPGFCRHVKDFVVGRHGYGKIKFFGDTDVRRLDLESLIQFNNREVIVYMDESKKPPVGQGLNKPAEVTLLNIKCFDRKTGLHYTEGPRIEKYKEMLKRKAEDQGAEFVSYDPVKGEWKFRVNHFSGYKLLDDPEGVEETWLLHSSDGKEQTGS